MSRTSSKLSRRTLLATLAGGGTVAAALARPRVLGEESLSDAFEEAFVSPFFWLERGDDRAWAAQVGKVLEVEGGAAMRVIGIDTFADYGAADADLIRPRAFAVNFEIVSGGRITGDVIHRVTHPSYGSFDLFVTTTPGLPTFAQAVFN
jgi:hypothetical protein